MSHKDLEPIIDFLRSQKYGVLSTYSQSQLGYPFGSLVPFRLTQSGRFVTSISRLAEHYRNLEADNRASIFVHDSQGAHPDPQAGSRATILGNFHLLHPEKERVECDEFRTAFPDSPSLPDFSYFALTPFKIRWIGGFGDIRWVSCERHSLI